MSVKLKVNAKEVKDVDVVVAATAGCAAEGCPGGGKVRVSSEEIYWSRDAFRSKSVGQVALLSRRLLAKREEVGVTHFQVKLWSTKNWRLNILTCYLNIVIYDELIVLHVLWRLGGYARADR